MRTLLFVLAVGCGASFALYLLAPSPPWGKTGDSLADGIDSLASNLLGEGEERPGLVAPAIPTRSPEPSPTPGPPTYDGLFGVGQEVQVTQTGGCLNVRTYPGMDAPEWTCLPDGTILQIILGPIHSSGLWWWAAAQQGWVADPYLAPVDEEPITAQSVARLP